VAEEPDIQGRPKRSASFFLGPSIPRLRVRSSVLIPQPPAKSTRPFSAWFHLKIRYMVNITLFLPQPRPQSPAGAGYSLRSVLI